jgi:hypothetical protein
MKKTFLVFLFIISTNLSAWWDTGHEMVCDEAYKLLTSSALKSIDPLIEEHGSFGRACLWADWIKSDRKNTRSWHYINLSDSEQDTYAAECPQNGCLISAFYEQLDILKDENSQYDLQKEALWFVGHLVGDIHQPMHAGYPEDLGGNRHYLEFKNGKKTNMHKLWDGQIIEHMEIVHGKNYLLDNVASKIDLFLKQDHSTEIEFWAQETRDIAMQKSVGYRHNELEIVTNKYMENHFEVIQERIALGAIRLSKTLNSIFLESN